jgi:hypothetical protein
MVVGETREGRGWKGSNCVEIRMHGDLQAFVEVLGWMGTFQTRPPALPPPLMYRNQAHQAIVRN